MLQRIQSIYLLFASLVLFALSFFRLPTMFILMISPQALWLPVFTQDVNGVQQHTQTFVALTAITAIVALIPLVIIFLYKNRKQQIAFCYSAILVLIGYSFWMAQTVKGAAGSITLDTRTMGVGLFLTSLSIILIIFAQKSIKKDEKLVKSADRLR